MKKASIRIRNVIVLLLFLCLLLSACSTGTGSAPSATNTAAPSSTGAPEQSPSQGSSQQPSPQAPSAAPSATQTGEAPDNTLLRVRLKGDIRNIDPCFITGPNDEYPARAVYEGLIRFIPGTNDYENMLAEEFDIRNDLEIYFKLREGVQFQRGYGELTADDVKWSFERQIDPETASAYSSDWATLDYVEVLSKYEGIIHLTAPLASLMTNTLPYTSGAIVCKAYYDDVGKDAFAIDPVGTGPYEFIEWRPSEHVILRRNPNYWGTPSYYEEIQLIPIADDTVAEISLESGDIDYSAVPLSSKDRFENMPGFSEYVMQGVRYAWVGMNMQNPKLQDINVRQAIRYGIDVDSILAAAYDSAAPHARAAIPEGRIGYWADAPLYEHDVAKARDYMAKAGLTSLDLTLAIENTLEWSSWAQVIQANLAEVGINITIDAMDGAAFWAIGDGDKGLDVELFCISYSAAGEPSWYTMWFTQDQIGVWNWMRWASPEFDALNEKGLQTMDPAERGPIYIEMQKLWDEACNSVWVTHTVSVIIYKDTIQPAFSLGTEIPVLRDFKAVG